MSVNYAYGSHPSLAINDENIVVEVYFVNQDKKKGIQTNFKLGSPNER